MSTEKDSIISTPAVQEGSAASQDFARLLGLLPVTEVPEDQQDGVSAAAALVVEFAKKNPHLIKDDSSETLDAFINDLNQRISGQLNKVMHHPEFQELEGSWRGLAHLVSNTETGPDLQIKVLNVRRDELGKELKSNAAWDQTVIYDKIYGEFDQPGAFPFGCIIGDYAFGNTPKDISILEGMAHIGAAAHAPFIAAAAPSALGLKSWEELETIKRNKIKIATIMGSKGYEEWRALREQDDSRFLGLTLPRFLARHPYSASTVHAAPTEYVFEEKVDGHDQSKYLWANSAYAMGANIARAFAEHGWCVKIRGEKNGGKVEKLPCHTFSTGDGDLDMKRPTEVAIGDQLEPELAAGGFMALKHYDNHSFAVFDSAQSVQQPKEYYNDNTTANAKLTARLSYLFASTRFAHYLKYMLRSEIGSHKERGDLQRDLNEWIQNFVCPNLGTAGEETKAEKPLAWAKVEVVEVPDNPGAYEAVFYLRPHYQLESVNVSLRLVSQVPEGKE